MKFLSAPLVSAVLLALGAISQTEAHSWLTKPVSRETGARSDIENKVGCPNKNPGKVTSYKAGETIDVRYWRNNHHGGFIRWSIVPKGKESHDLFDKSTFYYTCRESGPECIPKGANQATNIWAGDSSAANTIPCGDKITLPDWLPAGDYVLQWTFHSVGSSFGNVGWAEPQFRSCADIKLTTAGTKSAPPKCPTFVGGDRTTKIQKKSSDQCWYFYTNDIVNSQYKGSNTDYLPKYKFGIPAAVEKCRAANGGNSTAPASTPKPTMKPAATTKPGATTKTPVAGEATPKPAATTKAPDCKVSNA